MSTLVVSYKDLEDMVKNASKAAALLEEYADTIEDKVCRKLKEYSGNWTSNIDMADQLMKGKVERLRQKKEDFETLASNIETFKNNCKTADNNVKSAIQSLSGDFKNTYGIKENVVTKWFNYIGTDLVNSNALGRYLKDITNSVNINTRHAAEVIKDWYKYDDGKYIVDLLELYMKQKIDHGLSILRQVALGSFTDDVTLEGTVLQIVLGFTGFDLPCDIRDIIGDIYNLREPGQSKLPLLLDLISILPIVGALKYTDEIGTVLKNGLKQTDEAVTFIKKGLKNGDEIVDNAGKGIKGGLGAAKNLKPKNLMDELAKSGVKYNPDDVLAITKTADGKLLWLEKGNSKSGLMHILERHADDFASQGVNDIPELLNDVLKTTPINTGSNTKGLFADFVFDGNTYRVAYGTNGYVVSFYPID